MMKIMEINLKLRYNLFSKKEVADLFRAIIQDFIGYGKKQGFKPVFIIIPQKDDVLFIKKHKNYYHDFLQSLKKDLLVIDLTDYLEKREDLDDLYSDDNKYGGHPSRKGNEFIAQVIKNVLSDHKYV